MEQVILVDSQDREIGSQEKMLAHLNGQLHRAISVFIYNSNGEILLQQRALSKYHSGGLWTNTCCSHPRPGEGTLEAAQRRLKEEMGISVELERLFSFTYHAELDGGLIEHEFDHVFVGESDEIPVLNTDEAASYTYLSPYKIQQDIELNPQKYTEWFKIILNQYATYFANTKK